MGISTESRDVWPPMEPSSSFVIPSPVDYPKSRTAKESTQGKVMGILTESRDVWPPMEPSSSFVILSVDHPKSQTAKESTQGAFSDSNHV
uniref:Uncharacterized protein n=1 Tax=Kalanchoe fedtschenkoi TaxID=63787 RepID=A0A7N0UV26_KALFE